MKRKRYWGLSARLLVSALIAWVSVFSQASEAASGIDVAAYCNLTIASMEQQVQELEERITLVETYGNDPMALAQKEAEARQAHDEARLALYESYGTSDAEYSLFMGEQGAAVKAYLAERADVAADIESLSAQIEGLMAQYEALKQDVGGPPIPTP